ncbi:MAG: nucleotide exchange factor GrpE [Planctomycetota bacterium]|jgi:molecular chaperone GrpE
MKQKESEKPEEQKQSKPKANELKKLRQQLNNLEKEKNELFEKLQRVSADYANFQKRVPKQITDTIAYEKEKIIKTLLPALDNFEHTLQNAHSAESLDVLVKGIRIVYDQMLDILKSHGVEQIKALGEKFDPSLHQAMMQKAQSEQEENIVLEEFQKGYKLNGRVIRPTKVIVNKLHVEQAAKQHEHNEQKSQEEKVDLQEQTTNESTDAE